ncbi:MAG: hypothetical protein MZW92_26015 [Comamonadaceae bacterium]|nr:hypothetical protein [Comamonadaceae bacterium]
MAYQEKRRAQALQTVNRWAGLSSRLVDGPPLTVRPALPWSPSAELADARGAGPCAPPCSPKARHRCPRRCASCCPRGAPSTPGSRPWSTGWSPATCSTSTPTKPARPLVFPFYARPDADPGSAAPSIRTHEPRPTYCKPSGEPKSRPHRCR